MNSSDAKVQNKIRWRSMALANYYFAGMMIFLILIIIHIGYVRFTQGRLGFGIDNYFFPTISVIFSAIFTLHFIRAARIYKSKKMIFIHMTPYAVGTEIEEALDKQNINYHSEVPIVKHKYIHHVINKITIPGTDIYIEIAKDAPVRDANAMVSITNGKNNQNIIKNKVVEIIENIKFKDMNRWNSLEEKTNESFKPTPPPT